MPAKTANADTVEALRKALLNEGYNLSKIKSEGEQGTDISATKENEHIAIEVIAYKSSGAARRKDFFEAIFGALSRYKEHPRPTKVGIAISKEAEIGFQTRVNNIGEAWDKIGSIFPEFHFWFVDVRKQTYQINKWSEFKGT
jgi:hypothetical protein